MKTQYWYLWDATKLVLRENFMPFCAYTRNQEKGFKNLSFYLKHREWKQIKSKASKKEIIKKYIEVKKIKNRTLRVN